MHDAHAFLTALTVVLCVAAFTTVIFHRLRQPVVLGYILAGLLVGPHLPTPLFADRAVIQTLSEVGVILLMFSLGLEFSIRKLAQVGPTAGLAAIIQTSFMVWLGVLIGQAFGWSTRERLFLGAIIAISSTTIIAKAFDEQKISGKLRELVVGILIVEDLIAILLMALLTTVSTGAGLSATAIAISGGKLLAFLVGLVMVGMFVVPRAIRALVRLDRPEMTLVASVGLCFAVALLAHTLGYSVALGAFMAGSLVAESGEQKKVEHLVAPVRDMFAAIFFVSVGMLIDPALIARYWLPIAVITAVVIAGKIVGVAFGAFVSGNGIRTSVRAGMSLAQIGEFSFIIAGLGLSLGATGEFMYPIAVAVSALTTLTTPWLIRASDRAASFVDRKLPSPLQTFASLYGSWIEKMGQTKRETRTQRGVKKLAKLLLLDAFVLGAIVIGTSLSRDTLTQLTVEHLSFVGERWAGGFVLTCAAVVAGPFVLGVLSIARALGIAIAVAALPPSAAGLVDLAAAPRRAMTVTLQLAIVAMVALPLLAFTQPFVSSGGSLALLAVLIVVLGGSFWRSATNLEGHVKAGAAMIVEALAAQSSDEASSGKEPSLADVEHLLSGMGEPRTLRLHADSPAIGKTLAELDLRGRTGASVLAIGRGADGVIVPSANEHFRAGDVVAIAGTREAVETASNVFTRRDVTLG